VQTAVVFHLNVKQVNPQKNALIVLGKNVVAGMQLILNRFSSLSNSTTSSFIENHSTFDFDIKIIQKNYTVLSVHSKKYDFL